MVIAVLSYIIMRRMAREMTLAVQLGTATYCHAGIESSSVSGSLDVTDIHPPWRVNPVLPPLSVALHNIDPDTLSSVLKDPSITLPRKGRPRETRRLQTSAENVLNVIDRREKVRRCGPATSLVITAAAAHVQNF
ncbi:hypothetical protein V1519DRAFT_26786 [Lipomyces tetrasporus]